MAETAPTMVPLASKACMISLATTPGANPMNEGEDEHEGGNAHMIQRRRAIIVPRIAGAVDGWEATGYRESRLPVKERSVCLGQDSQSPARAHHTAFPANVCLVGTVLPSGFAQVSPRGSTMVFDDEHVGSGSGARALDQREPPRWDEGDRVLQEAALRESGLLPKGGIARFLRHTAAIHRSGPAYEGVWQRLCSREDRDPEKKGYACSSGGARRRSRRKTAGYR